MRLLDFYLLIIVITGFTTSDKVPEPSQSLHTDSHSDPANPFQDDSTAVSHHFGSKNESPLGPASVRQGGGYSTGRDDNARLYVVPQERTHNGQEKTGTPIFDLTHTDTLSLTDSVLSHTERDSNLIGGQTQRTGLSGNTLNTATSVYSNTHQNAHQRPSKIFSDTHDNMDEKIVHDGDITAMSSEPTFSQSHLASLGNRASFTEPQTSESVFRDFTDMLVMSSSHTTNDQSHEAHYSSKTFRSNPIAWFAPDFSQSNSIRDSVSNLKVTDLNSITYISDSASMSLAYTGTLETDTNRFPRSTHISENQTNLSLFDHLNTLTDMASASVSSDHPIEFDTTTISASGSDAPERASTTDRKTTDSGYYSYTLYSSNTHSTSTDLAPTQATHTVVTSHDTNQLSRANTQLTSSVILPTHRTSTRQDFTSTSASYSPNTLGTTESTYTLNTPTMTNESHMTPEGSITALYDIKPSASNHMTEINSVASESPDTTSLAAESGPTVGTHRTSSTSGDGHVTPTNPSLINTLEGITTSISLATTGQTSHVIMTTQFGETQTQNLLTTSRNIQIIQRPDTTTVATATTMAATTAAAKTSVVAKTTAPIMATRTAVATMAATTMAAVTQQVATNTRSQFGTLTPAITQTSSRRTFAKKTNKDWSQKGRIFIMDDQPVIINVETFQVLLQVILEETEASYTGLVEMERFLQNVAGYQSQTVTWYSGTVLQSVVTFRTAEAVSWLGRVESLLQEAGLKPLPPQGLYVSGVRVKNITVGGLHSDVCSWLFSCPADFSCVSDENVTCRSVCYSEFCRNHGICVHRLGQNPLCQCPVGEDFWFMGQHCDLRMTRQRLAGVCFGVLASIALLMGLLAFLAVQRFKRTLIQVKAEQTQSSYRRFNHFDELSARFWRRSWPGSTDSLDNTAFSRSDELLHMRAMDRACCYHDDTLSIISTYPESATHLNTVYPHSSQYQWDMSTCSLADGVIDSGKASDLSVCSWPIEPIQWTPFPLLQQLRHANTVRPSHTRSYCEGMEMVGLEKSRTA